MCVPHLTPNILLSPSVSKGVPRRLTPKIRRHAQRLANLTATDFKFVHYPPSMIAACCVSAAIAGLDASLLLNPRLNGGLTSASNLRSSLGEFCFGVDLEEVLEQLQRVTEIDAECLRQCHEQIHFLSLGAADDGVLGGGGDVIDKGGSHGDRGDGALTTPTDVEGVTMMIATR